MVKSVRQMYISRSGGRARHLMGFIKNTNPYNKLKAQTCT